MSAQFIKKMKINNIIFLVMVCFCSLFCNAIETKTQVEQIFTSNDQFSFKLYSHLKNTEENVIFSPLSINLVLSMLYAGAEANTKDEIVSVLDINDISEKSYHETWSNYKSPPIMVPVFETIF